MNMSYLVAISVGAIFVVAVDKLENRDLSLSLLKPIANQRCFLCHL
jgi:hypothetical protein